MKRAILFAILIAAAFAQNPATPNSAPQMPSTPPAGADRSDSQRLQYEINNLRSMLNAMGSQINTVQDPAVRDALRTNEQMWMLTINDMQEHVNQAQRQH